MRRQERSRSPSPRRSGNVGSARNDGGYVGDRGGSGGGYFRDDRDGADAPAFPLRMHSGAF